MIEDEIAVRLDRVLRILGWSRRKFFYRKKELTAAGVVFTRREGRPSVKRIYGFPSRIMKYMAHKAQKNELL